MITTIVLIRADPKLIPDVAQRLAGIDGVTDVYSVSGEWDLVAIVIGGFVICFFATLYPSRQAARLDPAQALRYE